MEDFKKIAIIGRRGQTVIVKTNLTNYQLIGKGWHGAVFKLSDERCVKIYASEIVAEAEVAAYKRIKGAIICPTIYEVGPNYIVMEYIEGITLRNYLKRKNDISETIAREILLLLQEMKKLGFTDIDFNLNNVIVTKNNILRLIDIVNGFKKRKRIPTALFKGLKELGLEDLFIEQVRKIDYNAYLEMKSN
ncbi:hypothetical protein IZY60_11500 [Lutibacter sp. B2]|nr:hypothetical protein [Lutibacter sp. B2]